ncbi:SPOR domain-containing protein [Sphingomonas sp. SUN019]|nr:SPOR domain-containing protein [Sphingomonas sp. SUN019]UVO51801.1 SPOR domain-containing protein [Sphingomonas sp. SUN019]
MSKLLVIPVLFAAIPAAAQAPQPQSLQMAPRLTPDADALAAAMRRLGANPRDLSSLIEAGELSLKLGDATAAASLFKRAELLDPMNGRVKAGMARILVQQERPGEALRFFDQAAGYGLDARSFAGDRGLAYDLIGQQTRAQRDYRLALASGPQAEVQRRYALSLAISGKKDEALAQIDPLVRQSDRGAWRTRAFILAMGGDLSGATDIATRMMPPGMATGLQPFFKTLPSLGPVDRAFAVHFGEIRPTPARLADARLAPALPALSPEPAAAAPVTLAQAAAPVLRADVKRREARERRQSARDRRREAQQRVQVARATRPAAAPLPDAPRYGSVNGVTFAAPREVAQSVPARATSDPGPAPAPTASAVEPVAATPAPVTVAPVQVASVSTPTQRSMTPVAPASALRSVPLASSASAQVVASSGTPKPVATATQPSPGQTPTTARPSAVAPSSVASAPQTVATPAPTVLAATPTPTPGFSAAVPAANPLAPGAVTPTVVANVPTSSVPATPPPAQAPARPATMAVPATSAPVAPQMSEDSILARIIAGISIPAEELGVASAQPTPVAVAPAPVQPQPVVAAPRQVVSAIPAARPVAPVAKPVVAKSVPTPAPTPKPTPTVDPKVAARKAAADKKAAEAKKLADAEKAAAAKKLADEKKAAKADPARIWVQVAGGANAGDLTKAWNAAQGKAAALKGKTAYSTPLRATNRVVTGPYKTDAEAQAMVNTLAKQGVSAFTFTSEVGQKVTRLSTK